MFTLVLRALADSLQLCQDALSITFLFHMALLLAVCIEYIVGLDRMVTAKGTKTLSQCPHESVL